MDRRYICMDTTEKERTKKRKNPFISSFLGIAIISCVTLSVIFYGILFMNDRNLQKSHAEEKAQQILGDWQNQIRSLENFAYQVTSNYRFYPGYFRTNITRELSMQVLLLIIIVYPLYFTVIAVIALYYVVGKWNDYFTGMLFLSNKDYFPLQLVLRNILLENQTKTANIDTSSMKAEEILYLTLKAYMAEAMKYSLIIISSLPVLIAYPFVQKYFAKRVMIGSIKG